MSYCAHCQITYGSDKRFCKECGSPLVEEPPAAASASPAAARHCGSCGRTVPEGDRFCPQCGAPLASPGAFDRTEAVVEARTPVPIEQPQDPPKTQPYLQEDLFTPPASAPPSTRAIPVEPPQENMEPQEDEPAPLPEPAFSKTMPVDSEITAPEAPAPAPVPPRRSFIGVAVVLALVVLALVVVSLLMWQRIKAKRAAAQLVQQTQASPATTSASMSEVNSLDERTKDTMGRMNALLDGIETYRSIKKQLPPSLLDLGKSMEDPQTRVDGWGNPLIYLVDLSNNTFVLISSGPDGQRDTADDIKVSDGTMAQWRDQHREVLDEWRIGHLDLYQQLSGQQISSETKLALEKKRLDREKAKAEAAAQQAAQLVAQKQQEEEVRRQQEEAARLAEQMRQQQEAQRRIEEERQRQQAEAGRKARLEKMNFVENFSPNLSRWAAASFQAVTDKRKPAMRIVGFGLIRDAFDWQNYTATIDVKIHKEAVNFIVRAHDRQNFYFLKLTDDKTKDYPKNSLIKFVYVGGKYLTGPGAGEVPGAYAVTSIPFKIKQNDDYRVVISVSGNTIRTSIDGQLVDTWQDNTFKQGSFGFNCSEKEQATVTGFQMKPN